MMNHAMNVTTIVNCVSNHQKLNWAKKNLNENTYKKIEKSYKDIVKYTFIIMLFLLSIYFIMLITQISTLNKYSPDRTRNAHVFGEKIWYIQNEKKEINLSDYGYNYQDYTENEKFLVYLDKDYNIITIAPLKDVQIEKNMPVFVMVGGPILILIIIFGVYLPICFNTFGKNWRKFGRWYRRANLTQDSFVL